MAHQSLYRSYRPQSFKEVAGQAHITGPLEEVVKTKKIGHAYLFSGSRGLGKTSVARIFAKEVGCTERDLHEIDAASNNGVDEIRALTESVYTLPFESPYKVYILDEVHMLSKSAWNAFLKTLEEPPSHAVFILATTELDRVPETVQSRCQVFEFKKPSRKELAAVCTQVAKKEGYALAPDAAELVAHLAGGSYRDALSVLQKCLQPLFESGLKNANKNIIKLDRKNIEELTGAPRQEYVHALLSALAKGDRGASLAAIGKASAADADMKLFLELCLDSLRHILLIRMAADLRESLKEELGPDEYAALELFAKEKGITHQTLLAFLNASDRIRYASIPVLPLELAIFDLFGSE